MTYYNGRRLIIYTDVLCLRRWKVDFEKNLDTYLYIHVLAVYIIYNDFLQYNKYKYLSIYSVVYTHTIRILFVFVHT